ncbi:MAG: histidine--tRNA ligase [Candidatus Nomurabacteria bacterium]|nr:histidine--tRNA ligase [Candidatus Nomurabacteria bacterium]
MAIPKNNKDLLQSPKGTRDISGDDFYRKQGFFEKAQEICEYYGFSGLETPAMEYENVFAKGVGAGTDIIDKEMYEIKTRGANKLVLKPEQTAATMRSYIEHGMQSQPQPIMWYGQGPRFRHDKPQRGRYRQFYQFDLDILGSGKPIMDTMVIHIAYKILGEVAGLDKTTIRINSIGDKDSRKEYSKALTAFYRKNISSISAKDRARLSTNPLRVLDSKEPETVEINKTAPQSIEFLNTVSKKHFRAVLENLDELEIPYVIDHTLVRGLDYYTHTVFEFFNETDNPDEKPLALGGGGRYDGLAKSMGHNKEVPAVGFGLGVDRIMEISTADLSPKVRKSPKVFFIQLGDEARMKSMNVIEELRGANIPIQHSLSKDGLSAQLGIAEKSDAPYALIFGQKEAMDGTAIIRTLGERKQKTVKIEDLAKYIKKLK